MSPKSAKGFFQVLDMICSLCALHQHVIHVHLHVASDLSFEDLIDEALVGGSGILQTEGHHFVAVKALGGHEGRMLFVLRCHLDLVISDEGIHEAEQSMTGRRIYQLVDLR